MKLNRSTRAWRAEGNSAPGTWIWGKCPPRAATPVAQCPRAQKNGGSMVSAVASHLPAKYPVRPARIHQDHWQEKQRADQKEALRARRGCRLPQREAVRDDHRPKDDRHAEV